MSESQWPDNTGARERLFLLAKAADMPPAIRGRIPDEWIYNAVSDRWSNGVIGCKVTQEADQSLEDLKACGTSHATALEMIR